jgi:hypothetical protein
MPQETLSIFKCASSLAGNFNRSPSRRTAPPKCCEDIGVEGICSVRAVQIRAYTFKCGSTPGLRDEPRDRCFERSAAMSKSRAFCSSRDTRDGTSDASPSNQDPRIGPANRALTIRRIEAKTTLFVSIAILVAGTPDGSLRHGSRESCSDDSADRSENDAFRFDRDPRGRDARWIASTWVSRIVPLACPMDRLENEHRRNYRGVPFTFSAPISAVFPVCFAMPSALMPRKLTFA